MGRKSVAGHVLNCKKRAEESSTRWFVLKRRMSRPNPPARKLSNFNFQGTKTLYQNNLKNIAFFFAFFKGYVSVISLL